LKKTEFVAGSQDKKLLEKAEKELQTEFIPDLYDKAMEQMFDQKYYNDDADGGDIAEQQDIDLKLLKDQVDNLGVIKAEDQEEDEFVSDIDEQASEKEMIAKQKEKKQEKYEKQMATSLKKQIDDKEKEEGFEQWFACD